MLIDRARTLPQCKQGITATEQLFLPCQETYHVELFLSRVKAEDEETWEQLPDEDYLPAEELRKEMKVEE